MKILVSGATGFVGKHLVPALIDKGHEIAVVGRNVQNAKVPWGYSVRLINYERDSFEYVEAITKFNPEAVIHLAGYLTSADDAESVKKLLEANIEFTTNLCNSLQSTQSRLFINTGSFSEYYYGDGRLEPAYFYSATKTAARYLIEYYAKKNQWAVVHVVPYTIYGPGDTARKVIDYLIEAAVLGKYTDMTDGEQVLDFIFIDDVVAFYCALIDKQASNKRDISEYHIGTGTGTSIRDLAKVIERVSGKRLDVGWGRRPYRPRDIFHAVAPVARAAQDFGWRASVTLREGVSILIDRMTKAQYE